MTLDTENTEVIDKTDGTPADGVVDTTVTTSSDTPDGGAATVVTPAADDKPKSALDAVTQAFKKSQEDTGTKVTAPGDPAAPKTGETTPPADAAGGPDLMAKIPKEEWDALAPSTRVRIQKFREKVSTLNTAVETLGPKAQIHDEIATWMGKSGVTQEDFVGALEVAALFRSNPLEALRRLEPIIEQLKQYSGDKLPEDLQKDLDKGVISEDRAKELARLRNEEARQRGAVTARTQADIEIEQRQQHEAVVQRVVGSAKSWEDRWKASDPDYPKKISFVRDRISNALQQQGYPTDPAAVLKICDDAKKAVETELSGMLPAKRSMTVIDQSGRARDASAPPTSALDAVTRGLAAAAAA